MVYFSDNFVESLLSTSADRGLYEALWLVSITKKNCVENSKFDFTCVSVESICNNLIAQWRSQDQRRNRFLLSTQLAFGALYVYQFQIDKLYDQAQNALRSCRLAFYDVNWMSQMSQISAQSTPVASQKTKKIHPKKTTGAVKANKQLKEVSQNFMDDFDAIEEFFKVVDDDVIEKKPANQTKKKKKNKSDSGIDPTLANDKQAITILEQTTMMTSGFQTLDLNDDLEGFGTENGMDFRKIFLESDEVFHSQHDIITAASDFLVNKRFPSEIPQTSSKRRRLTYDPIEDIDMSLQRENHSQIENNFPEIVMDNIQEDFSKISVISTDHDVLPQPMEISTSQVSQLELPENSQIDQHAHNEPPELVLSEIKARPRRMRKRKLIIDKKISFDRKAMEKNIEEYVEKHTLPLARDIFPYLMNELKSNEVVLLKTLTNRLKHSSVLHHIYERNLTKVLPKKRKHTEVEKENDEADKENISKKRRKTLRMRNSVLKNRNGENLINDVAEIPEINMTPNILHTEFEIVQHEELDLPPALQKNDDIREKPQVRRKINIEYDGTKLTKKDIILKLKQFWKKKDQSITMNKLCEGLSRITAAGVFFELMALSKAGVIELMHKEESLEIATIECKMSASQITKLYF